MSARLAATAFIVVLYAFAAWLLVREGRAPRRRRWNRGRRP
jgi:hypothetical protein